MTTSEAGLGATIRAWRARVTPQDVGLPAGRTRRAAGLRREELAQLAGMSVDYVVRLEQGRATTPSAQVVGALACALRLDPAERDHLYLLANLVPPASGRIPDAIPRGVRRVLSRLTDTAASVFTADWQQLWWNDEWVTLFGDPAETPYEQRNFARERFPTESLQGRTSLYSVISLDSEHTDAVVVSDLRRATGRFPGDPHLTELIRSLIEGNERFAELWARGTVAAHCEDSKIVQHPEAGPVQVDCDALTDGESELKIVLLSAVPGSEDEAKLRRITAARAEVRR